MDKIKKAQELARKERDMLEDWLEKAKEVNDWIPYVQRVRDLVNWQENTLLTMPSSGSTYLSDGYIRKQENNFEYLKNALPHIQSASTDPPSLSAVSSSAISLTFGVVTNISKEKNVEVTNWANQRIVGYQDLQKQQKIVEDVVLLLNKIDRDISKEFQVAVDSCQRAYTTNDISGAAIKIRNVLEHVKGRLFEIAIRRPQEQKINWPTMVDRLAKGDMNSEEHQSLMQEEEKNKMIWTSLTQLAKSPGTQTVYELKNIFTQYLDHLYEILSLINIE